MPKAAAEKKPTDASQLDVLRAATLGMPAEFVKRVVEANGQEFELREPTERQRRRIQKNSRAKVEQAEDGSVSATMDIAEMRVWCVIELTYIPGTNTHIFKEADHEVLMGQPTTRGWFKEIADSAWSVFNGEDEALDPKKSPKEKNRN